MHFHFCITCYIHYDNVKLETHHVPAVYDLCTNTSSHTNTSSSTALKQTLIFEKLTERATIHKIVFKSSKYDLILNSSLNLEYLSNEKLCFLTPIDLYNYQAEKQDIN